MNLSKVPFIPFPDLSLTTVRYYKAPRTKRFGGTVGTILLIVSLWAITLQSRAQRPGNTSSFEKRPTLVWSFATKAPILSTPVIDEDRVYFGSEDSTWYALELGTGKVKWKLRTNAPIRSTPLVHGNRIYLSGGNGVLTCAEKVSGAVVWRIVFDQTALFMGERSYDFADYYHSSPIIDDDVLYLATANGVIGAYELASGNQLWRYATGNIIHGKPVVAGSKIIVGCFDGNLYALSKTTGQLIWKFKTIGHQYFPTGEVQGSLASDGRRIFFGARDYNFYAIDIASGVAAWNLKFPQGWAMSATVADTVVYIGTSDDRVMVAADARSGREYWRTDVKFNTFGSAAITPKNIVFGTIWGKLYALDRNSGAIRWTFQTQGYDKHHLKYFDQQDRFRQDIGSILRSPFAWIDAEHKMGGIFSAPAISSNMIVVTTTEGIVYGLKE